MITSHAGPISASVLDQGSRRWCVSLDYQWLPTESNSGEVRCLEDINILHPLRHAPLYLSITSILAR